MEVVVRPTNLGLGFGDQVEASALKVNKKIEAEWKGVKFADEDEYIPAVEKMADAKNWKKKKESRSSRSSLKQPKGSAELYEEYLSINPPGDGDKLDAPVTIIDMRHKETRIITSMNDINIQSKIETYLEEQQKKPPKLGQELLYNINLIAESQDVEVYECNNLKSRCLNLLLPTISVESFVAATCWRGAEAAAAARGPPTTHSPE